MLDSWSLKAKLLFSFPSTEQKGSRLHQPRSALRTIRGRLPLCRQRCIPGLLLAVDESTAFSLPPRNSAGMTREEVRDEKQTHDKDTAHQTAGGRNHREFLKEKKKNKQRVLN